MNKGKNIIKSIFWWLIIISFIIYFFVIYIALDEIDGPIFESNLIKIAVSFIVALIMDVGSYYFIILIYLAKNLSKRKIYKEKLSENDLKNDKEYFRDILKNYNPLELSYIDDFNIDFPKDVIAMLLHLNKKGIIQFNNEKGVIQYSEKSISLTSSENFVLKQINNGKILINENEFQSYIEILKNECFEQGLLKLDNKKLSPKKLIIVFLISVFVCLFITNFFGSSFILTIMLIILYFIMSFSFVFYIIYLIFYIVQKQKNPYVRSKKGEEVNKKLEGLKNYLKDFSTIDEKNINELVIWEDYLIYSVLFNQNKKIISQIYDAYFIK